MNEETEQEYLENGSRQSKIELDFTLIPVEALFALAEVRTRATYTGNKYPPENWRGISKEDHKRHQIYHEQMARLKDRKEDHEMNAFCRHAFYIAQLWQERQNGPHLPEDVVGELHVPETNKTRDTNTKLIKYAFESEEEFEEFRQWRTQRRYKNDAYFQKFGTKNA